MPAEQRDDVIAIEIAVVHAQPDGRKASLDVLKNKCNSRMIVLAVHKMQAPHTSVRLDLDLWSAKDASDLGKR